MNIIEFTHIFLPHLLKDYIDGESDFHALVDTDLWKRVFPENPDSTDEARFFWYQIRLNGFQLKDGTLLLTYTLPTPLVKGQPKFAAIRLDRENRSAHYYLLNKPQSIDDQWDILWMPFPKAGDKMKLEFNRKIEGTDSLRNFILTVQQINFSDAEYGNSILSSIFRILKDTVVPME